MSEIEPLLRRLRETTGFELGSERLPEVTAAARRAMSRAGVDRMSDLVTAIDEGRASIDALVDDVMVGETYFFREPEQLRLLERELPNLPAPVSMWSAGCASGEEPYTMAMVADELGVADRVRILGTDLSSSAITKARAGLYHDWSLRGPDAVRARRWLVSDLRRRPSYTLDAGIKQAVTFRRLNLVTDTFPAEQHIIFCRNVLIYLQRPVIADIAKKLYEALAEGGWLVVASSDPPLHELAPYQVVHGPAGLVYRRSAHVVRGPSPVHEVPVGPRRPVVARVVSASEPPVAEVDVIHEIRRLADAGDLAGAERNVAEALRQQPMRADLHYLRGVIEVDLGRHAEAVETLRRALYLDGAFVMAWVRLGTTLRALGQTVAARRAFEQARRLCAAVPPDQTVPMADCATAAGVAGLAASQEAIG